MTPHQRKTIRNRITITVGADVPDDVVRDLEKLQTAFKRGKKFTQILKVNNDEATVEYYGFET